MKAKYFDAKFEVKNNELVAKFPMDGKEFYIKVSDIPDFVASLKNIENKSVLHETYSLEKDTASFMFSKNKNSRTIILQKDNVKSFVECLMHMKQSIPKLKERCLFLLNKTDDNNWIGDEL